MTDEDLVEYLSQIYPDNSAAVILAKLGEARSSLNRGLKQGASTLAARNMKGRIVTTSTRVDGLVDMGDVRGLLARTGRLLIGA
jgi:hypothetical protein